MVGEQEEGKEEENPEKGGTHWGRLLGPRDHLPHQTHQI